MAKNRNVTGRIHEKAVREILESEGYLCHQAQRIPIWGPGGRVIASRPNDVWGCGDLIGIKSLCPIRLVQVTADGGIGRKKDEMASLPITPHLHCEIWQSKSRPMKECGSRALYQWWSHYRLIRRVGYEFVESGIYVPAIGKYIAPEDIERDWPKPAAKPKRAPNLTGAAEPVTTIL